MARQRSPNYPSVDLGAAVEAAKALYMREGQSSVPPEVAVKAWGFGALSGNARSRLAGVRQYGVIENDRQGNIRLSPSGLTLAVADPSSPEHAKALRDAALTPEIFRELYETRRGASDDSLRHYLIVGRKFSADGAARLIESFRSTLALANLDDQGYDEGMENALVGESGASGNGGLLERRERRDAPPPPPQTEPEYRWPLHDGVVAEVSFHGGEFTADDIDLLTAYLDIAKRGRRRAAPAAALPPPETRAALAATTANEDGNEPAG